MPTIYISDSGDDQNDVVALDRDLFVEAGEETPWRQE